MIEPVAPAVYKEQEPSSQGSYKMKSAFDIFCHVVTTRTVVRSLLALISVVVSLPVSAQIDYERRSINNENWLRSTEPVRIIGNLHYVGTYDLAAYLITTDDGHFLINTGAYDSAALIQQSVEELGFDFDDIEILLTTQAHWDHVAGLGEIKRMTGARMMAHEGDVAVLEDGGNSDFRYPEDREPFFEPIVVDRMLRHQDTIELGGTALTLHHHPGHTRGSSSFTFETEDDGDSYSVLIVNMASINPGVKMLGMPMYEEIGQDYASTFAAQKALHADVWVSSHAAQFDFHDKFTPGGAYDPSRFMDPQGYRDKIELYEQRYLFQLEKEIAQAALGESVGALQMTRAATEFLASLMPEQREAVTHAFTAENRTNWSNTPPYVHARPGVRLMDLTETQRQAAHGLLRASTSSQGYQKLTGVIRLDTIHGARELERLETHGPEEGARPNYQEEAESFGSGSYSIAIFGNPDSGGDWGWLIQGHHMGATFTVVDGQTGFTPLFLGATPLVLEDGIHAGWSALSHEVMRGVELMAALTPEQRSVAVVSQEVPNDVLTGVGRRENISASEGLQASAMTRVQQRLLRVLIEEYVRNSDFDAAEAQLAAINATGWGQLRFSWRGFADDLTAPFYYRVQGERILIELTLRPNHVHTIVRDPVNDYGASWLGETFNEELSSADRFAIAVRTYESDAGNR